LQRGGGGMSSAPQVSVLMTVFNGGRFLAESVESVLAQSLPEFEFVIVDDASTDGSVAILESYASRDRRIRLFCNPQNSGQTPCLNQGLREARGAWIARQDADDLSHPMRLARQFERIAAEPDLALLGTCGRIIDGAGRLCGLLDMPLTGGSIRWSAALLNPFLHTSVIFRRDVVLEEFGGYDESFRISQDYDLWTRVIARHPSANLPWRLVCYRNLAASLSKTGRSIAFEEAQRVSENAESLSFGRALDTGERRLAKAFREGGLQEIDRNAFWKWYRSLYVATAAPDKRRLLAAHHLKVSGRLSNAPAAAIAEMLAAFRSDSGFATRWLIERLRG
jgi:glycosyltransferase involved in cell wall biosynthesis